MTTSNDSMPPPTLHKIFVRPATTLQQLVDDIRDTTSVLRQPVLLEIGQKSVAFQSPDDFLELKRLKRELSIALVLLMPDTKREPENGMRAWAKKANIPVFETQQALDAALQHGLLNGSRHVARTTGDLALHPLRQTTGSLPALELVPGADMLPLPAPAAPLPSPLLSSQSQTTTLVHEYVTGESLETTLTTQDAPMDEPLVLSLGVQMLEQLVQWAGQDPPVVHGNIAPAHIWIDRQNHVHLTRVLEQESEQDDVLAPTIPGYASPERSQGIVDAAGDLYALAACMHRMLTNREPLTFPAHNYPLVGSLNPRVSPATERVLARALQYDQELRFPSVAAMKQAIVAILAGDGQQEHSFVLPYSLVASQMGARSSFQREPTAPRHGEESADLLPSSPSPALSARGHRPIVARLGWLRQAGTRAVVIGLVAVLLCGLLAGAFLWPGLAPGARAPRSAPALGIGVTQASDGEYIGLSDGNFAFDTNRPDGPLMQQASADFVKGDIGRAQTLWESANALDPSDPEPLIFMEDQRVLASGYPWITLVVGTMASGTYVGLGQDDDQGAYLVQQEYNAGARLPGGTRIRLLIASTGNESTYAIPVAQQIVRAASVDHSIVGVMGWPYSSRTVDVVPILAAAHIPLVSQMASSVRLSGISRYFFRTVPPDSAQAQAGTNYIEHSLHARAAALFYDPADAYSASIGLSFRAKFISDGEQIVAEEHYTVGQTETIPGALALALSHNPDIIFFAGLAADASVLLTDLPTTGPFAHLLVMGGDGLYEVHSYSKAAKVNFPRLRFTAFAYPDEWGAQGLAGQEPAFFADYAQTFDPQHQHTADPYGFERANGDAILSYDAVFVMAEAARQVLQQVRGPITADKLRAALTADELRDALATITGPNAIQGVTGQIAFGPNGDAQNKAVVILSVSAQGFVQMVGIAGQFLK